MSTPSLALRMLLTLIPIVRILSVVSDSMMKKAQADDANKWRLAWTLILSVLYFTSVLAALVFAYIVVWTWEP